MQPAEFSDARQAAALVALEAAVLVLLRQGQESGEFDQIHIAAEGSGSTASIDLQIVSHRMPVGGFSL
ncbi:hypothetical protein PSQ39_21635 [Curvibacter sp. HBC28]|uniref:Uncharacterized protein n=1 Tax=Curvibacter microcysteis TaxID=3026419 RepID=A0ABT5MLI4_9BURK|nr:hypothetical protein [Curvibacter sp. HBC28]MDD0817251.1 hypothetical protein [Curvibacter sp. HBC28]